VNLQKREIVPIFGFAINVPEWFQDREFLEWLNNPDNWVFTWHQKGEQAGDWSDVVVCVDPGLSGDGSESDMPKAIWDEIVGLCAKHFSPSSGSHIHVRLTNLC
jgi:hypothetical protein